MPAIALMIAPAAMLAQTQSAPAAADPAAVPGDRNQIPALPPYQGAPPVKPAQTASPAQAPPVFASPAQAPVVATTPTAEHPNVARNGYDIDGRQVAVHDNLGSPYIPMDSWMYPALMRLYSMGYLDTAFVSLRPWTRRSVLHMLDASESDIRFDDRDEAVEILDKLYYALRDEPPVGGVRNRGLVYGMDEAYAGARIVGGTVLKDSFHLGTTFNNDYGRPYSNGFNSYNGVSALAELGPFSLNVRGEYQHAPQFQAFNPTQAAKLYTTDNLIYHGLNPLNMTILQGLQPAQNNFRILEASLGAHVLGHEVSFGKSDAWLGPGQGGAMDWSNNAEDIYAFRINRIEPLHIPYVSRILGDIRYDFFVGSLQGHSAPRGDYAHSEIISLKPLKDFQLSFQRTIVWGGKGHEPITLHTFLKGFFDFNDTTSAEKFSRDDPGARFSSVTFSWRLPYLRKYVTLYTDSTTHDDVFPISAPRRAGWRPGIFFTQLPYLPKVDLRVEATYTDYVTSRSIEGQGNYIETVQLQAYTNKGFMFGDWIGREAKGGQAWLTYHLSGNEWIDFQYLRKKNGKDFVQGTTQNAFRVDVVKRLGRDVELSAWFQTERWKAPLLNPVGVSAAAMPANSDNTGAFQVTWYPRLRSGS